MHKTPFSGLTEFDPGDNASDPNSPFYVRDPSTVDHFLEIGAVTHRHDAHAALGNPQATPSGTVLSAGGTIPADVGVYVGFTLVDADGGETTLSPLLALTTPSPYDGPVSPPSAVVTYSSGALMADTYYYGITLVDGKGGETMIGPVISVDREPGPAFGSITLFGLTADFAAASAVGWRLYKSKAGQNLGFYASGAADSFVDAGQGCVDCGHLPPTSNRTNRTNAIQLLVPGSAGQGSALGGVGSAAAGFRLYGSEDGSFAGAALLGTFPASSAGTVMIFPSLNFRDGGPPDVPTTVRGASRIDADNITNLFWRSPVANSGSLPKPERQGEARLNLLNGLIYAALSSGAASGGAGWTPIGSAGWINDVHAAGGGSATRPFGIEFVASGAAQVAVASAGGSARVTLFAPSGLQRLAVKDANPQTYLDRSLLEFVGSGGTGVRVIDIGGGSARVEIAGGAGGSGGGAQGPAGPPGGSFVTRTVASAALNLASGASGTMSLSLGSAYRVYQVNADRPARIELYANSAYQVKDVGRPVGTDPAGNHGVMLDFFVPDTDPWALSPLVDGASLETPPQIAIPVTLTNRGASGVVTVAVTYARTE